RESRSIHGSASTFRGRARGESRQGAVRAPDAIGLVRGHVSRSSGVDCVASGRSRRSIHGRPPLIDGPGRAATSYPAAAVASRVLARSETSLHMGGPSEPPPFCAAAREAGLITFAPEADSPGRSTGPTPDQSLVSV